MTSVSTTADGVCGRGAGAREQWAGECSAFHFLGSTDSLTQKEQAKSLLRVGRRGQDTGRSRQSWAERFSLETASCVVLLVVDFRDRFSV